MPQVQEIIERILAATLKAWTAVSTDPTVALPYMGVLGSVVAGTFALMRFLLIPLTNRFKERLRRKVGIRVIKPRDTKTLDAVIDLYRRRIEFSTQVDVELIRQWYSTKTIRNATNNTIISAICRKEVVGFVQLMWSVANCTLFVSYLVVDENSVEGRTEAAKAIINFAIRKYRRRCSKVIHFVFELERPDFGHRENREKAQRDAARVRRLKQLCRECGLWCKEIDVQYTQPEMPNDSGTSNQHAMMLLLAGRETSAPEHISADNYIRILDYMYFGIYARVYEGDAELEAIYKEELHRLLEDARATAPASIRLL